MNGSCIVTVLFVGKDCAVARLVLLLESDHVVVVSVADKTPFKRLKLVIGIVLALLVVETPLVTVCAVGIENSLLAVVNIVLFVGKTLAGCVELEASLLIEANFVTKVEGSLVVETEFKVVLMVVTLTEGNDLVE